MSLESETMDTGLLDAGVSPVPQDVEDAATTPDLPVFAPTPSKKIITYGKNSARKNRPRPPAAGLDESKSNDDDDGEPGDKVEREEASASKPTRTSARRQPVKPAAQPTSARQSDRKSMAGKGKSSPVASEGSDLTDIEDAVKGDQEPQSKTGRGPKAKTITYADPDSEATDGAGAAKPSKRLKTSKTARNGKQASAKAANGVTGEMDATDGSLSSAGDEDDAEWEDKDALPRGSARGKKRAETAKSKAQAKAPAKKGKGVDEADEDVPMAEQDEAPKSKRRKAVKSDDPKPAKQRKQPAAAKKEKKRASTSTGSPRKPATSTRKGKTHLKPESSTQLSDPFLAMVFGSSQPMPSTASRVMTDSESSDGDERQKVSRLFAVTNLTPQKRKGEDAERGGKRAKGKGRSDNGGAETDGSSSSEEDEPTEIEFKRDLTALDGTYVYCKNGRLGLYFGGVVVGYDDLKDMPHAKKKKLTDGIYLIRLPIEQDKVFRKRRDEFFTEKDEEFATCKLGETAPEVAHDGPQSDARERLSTPPLPPDIDQVEFETLDYMVQLQAIRPHLERIIREEYPPAQDRIDVFWLTGRQRSFPQWYGNISAHFIDDIFVPELTRWAIRPPLKRQGDGAEAEATQPARSTGSARYELLNDDERQFYVRKILLNEAIIYCCIKTMNLEQVGLDKLNERWADDDLYEEETDVERKTAIMRDLVARKELDKMALEDPDSYSIWASLMETRNERRTARGLPLEGEKAVEAPVKERGGRAARARNTVSYRE